MNPFKLLVAALGRMCVSAIFILSAVGKILNWKETEQALITALNNVAGYMQGFDCVHFLAADLIPWSQELLGVATGFELVGGLLVFLGIRVRLGAFLLSIFLIPATVLFHHYWFLEGAERELQMTMFLKNLSILGGLLIVLAFGTGSRSSAVKPAEK